MKPKEHQYPFRADPKNFEALQKIAKKSFRTVNSILNELVKKYIAEKKLTD